LIDRTGEYFTRVCSAFDVSKAPDDPGLTITERMIARIRVDVKKAWEDTHARLQQNEGRTVDDDLKNTLRVHRSVFRFLPLYSSLWKFITANRLLKEREALGRMVGDRTLAGLFFLDEVDNLPSKFVSTKAWLFGSRPGRSVFTEPDEFAHIAKLKSMKGEWSKAAKPTKFQAAVSVIGLFNLALAVRDMEEHPDAKKALKVANYTASSVKDFLTHLADAGIKAERLSRLFGGAAAALGIACAVMELAEQKNVISNVASLLQNSGKLLTVIFETGWWRASFLGANRVAAALEALGSIFALIDVVILGYTLKKMLEDPPGSEIFVKSVIARLKYDAGKYPHALGDALNEAIATVNHAKFHPLEWNDKSIPALRKLLPRELVLEIWSKDDATGNERVAMQYQLYRGWFWATDP
jgi:hypothetical protein